MFAHAATAGLMSVGVEVIDVGVPHPDGPVGGEHHHAGAGLILTASHNPIEWNALKLVGPDGIFLDGADGAAVRALAESGPSRTDWEGVGQVREDTGAIARHLAQVLTLPEIDAAAIRARHFTVASTASAVPVGPRFPRCSSSSAAPGTRSTPRPTVSSRDLPSRFRKISAT
jgi:phosphomannomutase